MTPGTGSQTANAVSDKLITDLLTAITTGAFTLGQNQKNMDT